MIQIVVYSPAAEEVRCIRQLLSAFSIRHSWADCQVCVAGNLSGLLEQEGMDILISDVSDPGAPETLKTLRCKYPGVLMFPIAGPEVPPTVYVCPQIMPCGLFWRPVVRDSANPVVEQMMDRIHSQFVPRSQSNFRISGKQKTRDVPYSDILCFEARDKKLVLRIREEELVFAGTLSQLEERLPGEFIRCHKSFLVNRNHIVSVNRSTDTITLDDGLELPISRGCKKTFWEVYGGESGNDI